MTAFRYEAVDAAGKSHSGVIDADTAKQARSSLRGRGLFPLAVALARDDSQTGGLSRQSLRQTQLTLLTRQWASLIGAGLTLEQALTAALDQAETARLRQLVAAIRAEVVAGHALGDALGQFPRVFSPLYLALVRAGEKSGSLPQMLERLADHLEASAALRARLLQALLYPAIVTVIAFLVILAMLTYVVPQVVEVFRHGKQTLPLLTRGLIALSDGLRLGWPWLLGLVIVGAGGTAHALRQIALRRRFHLLLLRLPVLGRLLRTLDGARFAQTLAILVSGGVPLLPALSAARDVVGLLPLRETVEQATAAVQEGSPLGTALARSRQFPPLLTHLISSGERAGNLPAMLERAARQQQDELGQRTSLLVSVLEPLLIVGMGGVVLLIVLALLQPVIQINQLLR
jgi:general secretion pathway protein F